VEEPTARGMTIYFGRVLKSGRGTRVGGKTVVVRVILRKSQSTPTEANQYRGQKKGPDH